MSAGAKSAPPRERSEIAARAKRGVTRGAHPKAERGGAAGAAHPAHQLQEPADDLLHDLVGAAVDLLDPRVGVHPRDRVLLHVAVAAEELEALVGDVALH